jgi:hypothetical protein
MPRIQKNEFFKGPKLLSLARKKAIQFGLTSDGVKLEELIWQIQDKEGNTICFRKRKTCNETLCCWQASCSAEMLAP